MTNKDVNHIIFPTVMNVAAKCIGFDLISMYPSSYNEEEFKRYLKKKERKDKFKKLFNDIDE